MRLEAALSFPTFKGPASALASSSKLADERPLASPKQIEF
jgi:hypothetical protein